MIGRTSADSGAVPLRTYHGGMLHHRRPGPAAPARLRRAVALAGTSAVLAALAHIAGGAALPDLWLLALGGAAVAGAWYPLLGHEAGWLRITLGLALAQVGLHFYLATVAGHAHHSGAAGAAGHGDPATMLIAHVLATVVAVVWLRIAEQGLWRRARQAWVRALLAPHALRTAPALTAPPPLPAPRGPVRRRVAAPAVQSWGVRGPPLLVGP